MKAYVINLERSPERKIYMQKLLKKFPFLDVEFVTAVDGRAMNENERIHQFDVDKFYARYSVMPRPGEIGCTLSHQKCYCKMVKDAHKTGKPRSHRAGLPHMRWCVDQPVFCRPAATPETVHRMR